MFIALKNYPYKTSDQSSKIQKTENRNKKKKLVFFAQWKQGTCFRITWDKNTPTPTSNHGKGEVFNLFSVLLGQKS